MDETGYRQFTQAEPSDVEHAEATDALHHIGFVMDIAGSSSQITLDASILTKLMSHGDPSIAMAGQVGSQIKIRIGHNWLLASIRTQRMHDRDHGVIMAQVDFWGEGDEERLTGKISNFRRGVTRYPIPGSEVYAVSSADMDQVYATDARAHVEIGTVFPTQDIRGALYVDALLGKHFALVGSTGTGKSTCAALIVHKMCEIAPDGHIVMIDPHGEYSAAFKQNGALFDVNNLAMPYWMMNFAEHCEVFVTSTGDDRQIDSDILARCLLQARAKNRIAETIGKLTVDAPIPYLLSDLTNILQNEMGKLDKATSSAPFMRLKSKIDELKADPRYNFMFQGCWSATPWPILSARFSVCHHMVNRFRLSMCPAPHPTSRPPLSRCCRVWCLTMPSGRATNRSAPSCSFAKRRIATFRRIAFSKTARCAPSLNALPRRAVNMVCRLA